MSGRAAAGAVATRAGSPRSASKRAQGSARKKSPQRKAASQHDIEQEEAVAVEYMPMLRPWAVEAFCVLVLAFFLAMLLAHTRNQMVYTQHQMLVDESRVCVYGFGMFATLCLLIFLLSLGARECKRWWQIAEEERAANRKAKAALHGLLSAEKRRLDFADQQFVQAVFVGGQANRIKRKAYLLVAVAGLLLSTLIAALGVLGVGKLSKFGDSENATSNILTAPSVIAHLQVNLSQSVLCLNRAILCNTVPRIV